MDDDDFRELFKKIPKHEEFSYVDVLDKLVQLIDPSTGFVTFDSLKDNLLLPPIHHNKDCTPDCSVKIQCERVKEILRFLDLIKKKLMEYPAFKDLHLKRLLIGSGKEGTKIGQEIDEVDVHLMVGVDFKSSLAFDQTDKQVYFNRQTGDNSTSFSNLRRTQLG